MELSGISAVVGLGAEVLGVLECLSGHILMNCSFPSYPPSTRGILDSQCPGVSVSVDLANTSRMLWGKPTRDHRMGILQAKKL